jgi:hypothetical protein
MSKSSPTRDQGSPLAGSHSAVTSLFAQSPATVQVDAGEGPTPRRGRRTTVPGRAQAKPDAQRAQEWRGPRPGGRALLVAVTAGVSACALLVAVLAMPAGQSATPQSPRPVERDSALSEPSREGRGAAARAPHQHAVRQSRAASRRRSGDGRRRRRPVTGRPASRPVPRFSRAPSRSAPAPPAEPIGPAPAVPQALPQPPVGEGVAPTRRGFPPPARWAPALPAPVPPGSPPEFL